MRTVTVTAVAAFTCGFLAAGPAMAKYLPFPLIDHSDQKQDRSNHNYDAELGAFV
jgi:hypothetical protein